MRSDAVWTFMRGFSVSLRDRWLAPCARPTDDPQSWSSMTCFALEARRPLMHADEQVVAIARRLGFCDGSNRPTHMRLYDGGSSFVAYRHSQSASALMPTQSTVAV